MDSRRSNIKTVALVCTALNILGGLSRHILQLYRHLDRKKFRIIIVYFSMQKELIEAFFLNGGVVSQDLFFVPFSKKKLFLVECLKMAHLLRRERVAIMHTFLLHSDILGFFAAKLAGVKTFISSVEGQLLWDEVNRVGKFKQWCYRYLNRFLRQFFDLTITVSEDLKEEVLRASPSLKNIRVIPVGVACYIPYERLSSLSLTRHDSSVVIGCLSQLNKDKGVEYLIRAIPFIKGRFSHARFLIGGTGEAEFFLKRLAEQLHVEESISFLGWVKDTQSFLLGLDAFVMPSVREGCPMALLEALSLGRPVVAFRVPGIKEIIQHGENGLLASPFDVEDLARQTVDLCQDKAYAKRMGAHGYEMVKSKYSVESEMKHMETEYLRVLGEV